MKKLLFLFFLLLFFSACKKEVTDQQYGDPYSEVDEAAKHGMQQFPDTIVIDRAIAVLHPTSDNNIKGIIRFEAEGNLIRVTGEIEGLHPNSKHGIHIHEFGDCTAPDASSAGGHFNPFNEQHGPQDAEVRHAGDFGNLESDGGGRAKIDFVDYKISFHGTGSIIGKAVIVHTGEDDLTSQPTGESGARAACGIIGIAR
jgi:superoxide dismutase, Cu-Zn family